MKNSRITKFVLFFTVLTAFALIFTSCDDVWDVLKEEGSKITFRVGNDSGTTIKVRVENDSWHILKDGDYRTFSATHGDWLYYEWAGTTKRFIPGDDRDYKITGVAYITGEYGTLF